MAAINYTYDALYETMKNHFTVVKDNCEYTLGGYMRTKAGEKTQGKSLPMAVSHTAKAPAVIHNILVYVNDKMTVKEAPAPEKTLTSFPLRASLSSLAAALLLCTLMFSFAGISKLTGRAVAADVRTASVRMTEEEKTTAGEMITEHVAYEANV